MKRDTYAVLVCGYGARCHGCRRRIRPGSTAYGSAPGVDNRRKRWRWLCSRECALEKLGVQLEPFGAWAQEHERLEAVRQAQRVAGGAADS